MNYYTTRTNDAATDDAFGRDYWVGAIDPDGHTRDLTAERDIKVGDMAAEIGIINAMPAGRVLDVGCGLGHALSAIDHKHDRHGVEPSNYAAEVAGDHGAIVAGTLQDAAYPDDHFDAILCHHVIEHVPDPVELLVEMRRVMKPGGRLIICTPDFDSTMARRYGDRFRLLHDKTHISLFSTDSMSRMLRDFGFRIDGVDYPFFGGRHDVPGALAKGTYDDLDVSPSWPGNIMSFYCRLPAPVVIGGQSVGFGHPCYTIAEIGINHNGSVETALELITAAKLAGADAVKFQKRTVDRVYTAAELAVTRESPFGTTNGDLKYGLELGMEAYDAIDRHCSSEGIEWFTSCWDVRAVDFIEQQYDPPCHKIASALLTDDALLRRVRDTDRPVILSTGMSTLAQIDHAVEILGTSRLILMHCNASYPADVSELNLAAIKRLGDRYGVSVGYSGHEVGLSPSVAAVALGACAVERHITMDRSGWGSDQSASVEPNGFARMVRDIRSVQAAIGDGVKRVYDSERPAMAKLRRSV
jgi:N-acetylneuraminate synthase